MKKNDLRWLRILTLISIALVPAQAVCQVTESFTEPISQRTLAISQSEIISRVHIEEGSRVKQGEMLAELFADGIKHRISLAEQRASSDLEIKLGEIRLQAEQQKLNSLMSIREKGFSSTQEIENAKLALDEAKMRVELANFKKAENETQLKLLQSELRKHQIISPIDGIVTEIFAQEGEVLSGMNQPFAEVVDISKLKVKFFLKQKTAENLAPGDIVTVAMTEYQKIVEARVKFVSPILRADSGTAQVDLVIDNDEFTFMSGTPCKWLKKGRTPTSKFALATQSHHANQGVK